jgi:peroxiredoxin Q/BCP
MKVNVGAALTHCLVLALMFGFFAKTARAQIKIDQPWPAFEMQDQHGRRHRLEDYAGKWLVLYFYPRDDTPGCTIEACKFRDDLYLIRSMNADVLGVSLDSVGSHARFAADYGLPFPLLADRRGEAAAAYGVLLSMGPLKLARRNTFLIDPKGNIARIYRKVDPKRHSEEVIADLRELQTK